MCYRLILSCTVKYDGQVFPFNIDSERKISIDAGNCLVRTAEDYWFRINPSCFDKAYVKESIALIDSVRSALGFDGLLIGEQFMATIDPVAACRRFITKLEKITKDSH